MRAAETQAVQARPDPFQAPPPRPSRPPTPPVPWAQSQEERSDAGLALPPLAWDSLSVHLSDALCVPAAGLSPGRRAVLHLQPHSSRFIRGLSQGPRGWTLKVSRSSAPTQSPPSASISMTDSV